MFNHQTKNKNVKMFVDSINRISESEREIIGWIAHDTLSISSLRIDSKCLPMQKTKRTDVKNYYKNLKNDNVGFHVILESKDILQNIDIELETGEILHDVFSFDKWMTFHSGFRNVNKNLIVVDDFYDDPDLVRNFALKNMNFSPSDYHKGKRSEKFILNGTKEKFEEIIGRKIINWEHSGSANGVFQYCIPTDPLVYHIDSQNYAAIIFLSPNAPLDTGTATYQHKKNKIRCFDKEENSFNETFSNEKGELDFYDSTNFELVDRVANVYNRLILFNSKCIHAATRYYGNSIDNSRFFQIFFFDVV